MAGTVLLALKVSFYASLATSYITSSSASGIAAILALKVVSGDLF